MKKSISPLIAYVMLVGFTVIIGVFVSNYIINQTREQVSNIEKGSDLYCPDTSINVQLDCYKTFGNENNNEATRKLNFTFKNTGSFNIINITLYLKYGTELIELKKTEHFSITSDSEGNINLASVEPGINAHLLLSTNKPLKDEDLDASDNDLDLTSKPLEVIITPIIHVEDKNIICNEKVFKLKDIKSIRKCLE
ncbi:MAG: hypothetical protein PHD81_00420 [Candidatus Nanoarchaeia archaeon]|nr:hypothetical protein [Candidatus Nanoarchaeia archaeon]MDD5587554.1 hypothetical protein [Candidatus Nanoarchaeia archaeon]